MTIYVLMMLGILFAGLFRDKSANPIAAHQGGVNMPIVKRRSYYAIFILFFLWIFLAFRGPEIGSDTPTYVDMFDKMRAWVESNRGNILSQLFVKDEELRYETGGSLRGNDSSNPWDGCHSGLHPGTDTAPVGRISGGRL